MTFVLFGRYNYDNYITLHVTSVPITDLIYRPIVLVIIMRGGQKVLATIFFLFTWMHLHKEDSVCIKAHQVYMYEPFSVIPPNMVSIIRLVRWNTRCKSL